jgi:hypothetical protein
MTDEKYQFIKDVTEKNSLLRGARSRKTHNGKRGRVKFPSDYLTKKELQKMNGECKSYRLNDPMEWDEFISMPDDVKISYIKLLRQKFDVPGKYIARMLGVNPVYYSKEINRLGISVGKNSRSGNRPWDKKGFWAWVNGTSIPTETKEEETLEESVTEEIPVEEPVFPPVEIKAIALDEIEKLSAKAEDAGPRAVPDSGNMVFEGNSRSILNTIDVLLRDTKCRISITWDVLD